jgi:nitrogen regulatory protein PII
VFGAGRRPSLGIVERNDEMKEVFKAKLVTIIASSEFVDRLAETLRSLGARGYTMTDARGRGVHGPRGLSFFDAGNARIETIVPAAVADKILEHIVKDYAGDEIIAFSHDVDAVPKAHFD